MNTIHCTFLLTLLFCCLQTGKVLSQPTQASFSFDDFYSFIKNRKDKEELSNQMLFDLEKDEESFSGAKKESVDLQDLYYLMQELEKQKDLRQELEKQKQTFVKYEGQLRGLKILSCGLTFFVLYFLNKAFK